MDDIQIYIVINDPKTGRETSVSGSVQLIVAAITEVGKALKFDSSLTDHVQSLKNIFDNIKDELDRTPN